MYTFTSTLNASAVPMMLTGQMSPVAARAVGSGFARFGQTETAVAMPAISTGTLVLGALVNFAILTGAAYLGARYALKKG